MLMCRDASGATPLHMAALHGNLAACEVLIEYGAKRCLKMTSGRDNQTPEIMAKTKKHQNVTFLLQNVGKCKLLSDFLVHCCMQNFIF